MAYIVADRIKETTTVTGTGPATLLGAVSGYRTFASSFSIGDTCAYAIVNANASEWEIGIATYSAANTLTRTTVQSSTNANAVVNFSAGTKDVFLGITAGSIPGFNPITNTITSGTWNGNTIDVARGGTGLTALGTANQVLSVNSAGTALEYHTITSNPGTVTSVSGTGTVNGLTLTGTVTTSGNLTLGGTLSNVDLTSQITGTLPVANGGTGVTTATGSGSVVLSTTPTLVTPQTNSIAAVSVTGTSAGNTLALAGSNASTTGAGGNVTITGGNGSGVGGTGGNIILQPGAQGSSGGDGSIYLKSPSGTVSGIVVLDAANNRFYLYGGSSTSNLYLQFASTYFAVGNWILEVNASNGNGYTGFSRRVAVGNTTVVSFHSSARPVDGAASASLATATNGTIKVFGVASNDQGGSFSFPSSTTAFSASTNNLVLTGSAFQRINCTVVSSLTGVAPTSSGTHVDGRMIRIYNVGAENLTLAHNSASSTAANRFFNSTGADIVLSTHQYVELIYDSTDNGRGGAGWRVSSIH